MPRVLVVGSDGTTVADLRAALGDADVEHVTDVAGALELLTERSFDCAVVGTLPVVDPDRVETHLRDHGHTVPVVHLEGRDPEAVAEDALERAETARLTATRQRRSRSRSLLSDLTAAVRHCQDEEEVARTVCEHLAASSLYRAAWIGRWDEERGTIVPMAASGLEVDTLAELAADPEGTVAGRVPVEWSPTVASEDAHVTIAVPITGDSPRGVLQVYGHRPAGADPGESETLVEIGKVVGAAMASRPSRGDPGPAGDVDVLGDTLAHELGNQLDAARVQLELARERDGGDHLSRVEEALERISDLADDARALARGTIEPEPRPLPEAAEEAWATVETGGATLSVEDATIEADPDLLQLLLENLFRNAIQHGTEQPVSESELADHQEQGNGDGPPGEGAETRPAIGGDDLTVRVGPLPDGFYVGDDGPGIPPDEREAVFEWGYTTGSSSGAGLGIVSMIADRHGWSVDLVDGSAGGARFEFRR